MAGKEKDSGKVKDQRRGMIRRLITAEKISTQMELSRRLEEMGFQVTQATVSRDIRELRLVKTADGEGSYYYTLSKPSEQSHASGKFFSVFQSSVLHVDSARNLVVVRTETGMAQAVCATMDGMNLPGVLGTIAGDDTILVIARDDGQAEALVRMLREM